MQKQGFMKVGPVPLFSPCPAFFPRLILQYNKDAMAMFNKDPKGNLARADVNWKKLVEQHGK